MATSPKSSSSSSPAARIPVLERIHIKNFAVARDVVVEPGPGLNVFTGETGAGKSLVVDALAFAFGARRGRESIATGAERALVEVHVNVQGVRHTIERSISANGRSAARLDGSTTTVETLQQLAQDAIEIHGQSDQLAVLRPAMQRDLLDAYAGLLPDRQQLAALVRELRDTRRTIESLATDTRERERRIDQLRFEVDEIEQAGLHPGEDETLRQEHARLAGSRQLIEAAERALAAIDTPGMGEAVAAIGDIAGRDESASALQDLAATMESTMDELHRELRHYREGIEEDPERLAAVEERLDLLARLRRKYGDSIVAILAYGAEAAEELAALERADTSVEELAAREARLLADTAPLAQSLSAQRREAASRLVAAVAGELEALGMGGGNLAIGFGVADDARGPALDLPDYDIVDASWSPAPGAEPVPREIAESGADRVEFLASFNQGQDPRPLASVASGGETSRFLLALATVFGTASEPRAVVLDEVDEGVGGRAGVLVGRALQRLAERHQVLCITHLPQVAAYGDYHFAVTKQADGHGTWSSVQPVAADARLAELAAMLGGETSENTEAARALLNAASAM